MDKLLDDLDVAIRDFDWVRVKAAAAALRSVIAVPTPAAEPEAPVAVDPAPLEPEPSEDEPEAA